MNNTFRLHLAAVAGLLALTPVAASAADTAYTTSPVTIRSVSNDQNSFDVLYASQRYYENSVNVGFVNAESVPATRVEFAFDRNGRTQRFSTAGTFAPGTLVEAQLDRTTSVVPALDANVTIAKVDFADGTSWTPATGRVASASLRQSAAR